jgi:biotin carboxyl carrier protein
MFVQVFGADLEADDVQSGLYLPLKDEEGVLGVLLFEASQTEFIAPVQREVAAILANQTAVALRNAQLYHQVPMVDALGAFAAKKRELMAVPRRKAQIYGGVALALMAAALLIRWPFRVTGSEPVFRPVALSPVRAWIPGIVERVFVNEGAVVAQGTPLAALRSTGMVSDRAATAAAVAMAERQASLAASQGDPAGERLHRIRGEALRQELSLLDEQLAFTTVRAPTSGVVLTPHLLETVGASVEEGDLLVTVGRIDTLELEFGVDQREVSRIAPGQEVRVRVDALPQHTFSGTVISVGQLPLDSSTGVRYPVRARVANPDGILKPQMKAYARVLTAPMSAVGRSIRAPQRWLRLIWWRLWS